jgi:hypothetical protein
MTIQDMFVQSFMLKKYYLGIGLEYEKAKALAQSYFDRGCKSSQDDILNEILGGTKT